MNELVTSVALKRLTRTPNSAALGILSAPLG
jgi:hypothetical protein